MDAPLLTTTGAAIAALVLPFLTAQVKRLPWRWLTGQGLTVNLLLAVVTYLAAWKLDHAPLEALGHYLLVALTAGGLGSAAHSVMAHGPQRKRLAGRRVGALGALAIVATALCSSACASSTPGRLVQAIEVGADLHRETMRAAGAAAERHQLAPEDLDKIAYAGRRAELTIRTARATVDLYLAARQLQAAGASTGDTGASASAAVADLGAALLELMRTAIALGIEVKR